LLGQRLLQCSLTAQQRGQGGRLLETDADGGVCQGRAPQQQAGGGEQGGQQGAPATRDGAMGVHVLSLQTRWRTRLIAEPDRERRRQASGCPVIRCNKAKQSKKRTINNFLELNYARILNS